MTSNLLIRNAQILLPNNDIFLGDLSIKQGKIAEIGSELRDDSAQIIDGTGLTLLPGVIDPQVHFREPGLEHKEDLFTASCACAKGGVTSFLEMPNTVPLTTTQATLDDKLYRASQKCLVNYGFFMGATAENLDDLRNAHPACGIKIFMGSNHGALLVSTETEIEPIFAKGSRLIAVHAEDQARIVERKKLFKGNTDPAIHSQIQDEIAALNATKLAVKLANKYQRRLHILHLSTGIEAEYLRQHKTPWISTEVTPQHLLLNTTDYERIGTLAQMNPPLRSPENNDILWKALLDGVIDCIATDHAPHTLEEKAKPYPHSPSGMPGVETSLPLMLTEYKKGRCTLAQVVKWMCTNPAKLYNIPHKGEIKIDYDADLTLVDLNSYKPVLKENLATKCKWSPFEGWNLTGWPIYTIVNGNIALEKGQLNTDVRGKALSFS
ncbi:dihydroorotase [Geminocystis sp. NIES-3709]|uniref:dihydroorotase n=1 Tax=Geminocystis sp. NIES-3709 TaxID=1617448 RepID=UPI0005FC8501|nr:dihydroorotase [Geminocystis sp. NIES-3709]BAQ63745.1 dihydroorotase [Geminocystis sp. NIES-3709]